VRFHKGMCASGIGYWLADARSWVWRSVKDLFQGVTAYEIIVLGVLVTRNPLFTVVDARNGQ
jgi:hypothetical protein